MYRWKEEAGYFVEDHTNIRNQNEVILCSTIVIIVMHCHTSEEVTQCNDRIEDNADFLSIKFL